jgi:predicted transcriptional regulator
LSKKKESLVRDLTIDDEFGVIESNKSVKEAALKMKELGIPDLVVVNDQAQKYVLGVIADFDIVTGIVAEDKPSESTKVTDVMYTIEPVTRDTSVQDAFTRMRDLDVPIVPVVEKNKLIGVVSIADAWGYLPEKYEDQKGLFPVNNPRLVNYAFSLVTIILYLFIGIFTPLFGISELFTTNFVDLSRGDTGIWIAVTGLSILIILLGILSTILIIQWAYADYSFKKGADNWKNIGIILGLVNIILIWVLFTYLMFSGYEQIANSATNTLGIIFGIVGLVFLLFSVFRDFVFVGKSSPISEES